MKTNINSEGSRKPTKEINVTVAKTPSTRKPGQSYRRVLVGTDFTPASDPAFEFALRIAKENQAELLIAHAYELPSTMSFMPPECYDECVSSCRNKALNQIGVLMDKAHKEKVHCHALVLTGIPDDVIVGVAKKLEIDLIVTGTHGRRGISRFFEGSVSSQVVAHAPCSVLTVRSAVSKANLN